MVDDEAEEFDNGVVVKHAPSEEDLHTEEGESESERAREDPYDGKSQNNCAASGSSKVVALNQVLPERRQISPRDLAIVVFAWSLITWIGRHFSTPNGKRKLPVVDDSFGPNVSAPKRKKKTYSNSPVVEIESSSEEDLEVLAEDDSMFKQPINLKTTKLPPSLATKSSLSKSNKSASKMAVSVVANEDGVAQGESEDKDVLLANIRPELHVPPFVIDGKASPAALKWIASLGWQAVASGDRGSRSKKT
ncbi:hypothetical protein C8R45DRAFT_931027 [Mycena sanguinolenta]|nr:hypothetical protein C8R45DRAFT_931027 [Mycena sanguinolenta]